MKDLRSEATNTALFAAFFLSPLGDIFMVLLYIYWIIALLFG
tara:strand:+ start:788 stop:913 length:126 start_codon:yes stop_codon:yes gene_type:complete